MKIGIVTDWFEGGSGYVARQYLRHFKARGEVCVYARGNGFRAAGDPEWELPEVTWGRSSVLPLATAIDLRDFDQWLEANRPDTVFFIEQRHWDPVILCRDKGIKTGSYVDYYTEDTVPLFGLFDFLICNTRRHHQAFDWHEQCHYVPWGTEVDVFTANSFEPVNAECLIFFESIGKSPHRKGTDLLLEAFARVRGEARLVLHAQVDLASQLPRQRELIGRLEGEGRLRIISRSEGAPGLYHLGDVYVYPSRLDGIGLSMAEALACGLPLIVPDCPPMTEFVDRERAISASVALKRTFARRDGYYWPQCEVDTGALAATMEDYIERFDRIAELKAKARAFALEHLDWSDREGAVWEAVANSERRGGQDKELLAAEAERVQEMQGGIPYRLYRKSPTLYAAARKLARGLGVADDTERSY
ncbi:MAG: glycosyltransferase family 4 protein [Verrucomicrobiales bacterium]